MRKCSSIKNIIILLIAITSLWIILSSCSSVDYYGSKDHFTNTSLTNENKISLVTYNIKAIYDKEDDQINNLMKFINGSGFDFVLIQELFDESMRDDIMEKSDTSLYKTIISRVDYNSFPEFIFQDAGLYMMSKYPRINLSNVDFRDDINNSNGVIHMILDKEMSKTNDFLANKSVLGTLFNINDSTQLFLFTTHVQAIGTTEHKEFQLDQIGKFIYSVVNTVVESNIVEPQNLIVLLAGDFNSNAYSYDRFLRLQKLLGNPRDLHMEHNGHKKEYTFRFGSRKPSRRFDYIFAYDQIGENNLKKVSVRTIGVEDVIDNDGVSISDHAALKASLILN